MLTCTEFFEEYSDYRDGLLGSRRREDFLTHLRHCPSCARYDRVLDRGAAVCRELPQVEPSADFMTRLQLRLQSLDRETTLRDRRASGTSLGITVAIAAALGALAWAPLARPAPALLHLPPVAAHAPYRVEAVHALFRPGPLLVPRAQAPLEEAPAPSLLFRYSPLGAGSAAPALPVRLEH